MYRAGTVKKVRSQVTIYDYLKNIEKQTRRQKSDVSDT